VNVHSFKYPFANLRRFRVIYLSAANFVYFRYTKADATFKIVS